MSGGLDRWKPAGLMTAGGGSPPGHVPMALSEGGRSVTEEPRWHALPGGLAATLPAPGTELDSWFYKPQTMRSSTTGELRQEVIAWRLSSTALVEVIVARPLEPNGAAYRPAGPWALRNGTIFELEQIGGPIEVPTRRAEEVWGTNLMYGAASSTAPKLGTLEEAIADAPQRMRDLLPPASEGRYEASWGLAGQPLWGVYARSRSALGWVYCRPKGFLGGRWRIVSERPVDVASAALAQAAKPGLTALTGRRSSLERLT